MDQQTAWDGPLLITMALSTGLLDNRRPQVVILHSSSSPLLDTGLNPLRTPAFALSTSYPSSQYVLP